MRKSAFVARGLDNRGLDPMYIGTVEEFR